MQESLLVPSQEQRVTPAEQLRLAFEYLKQGKEFHENNREQAAKMYKEALSLVTSYLQHPFENGKIENPSSVIYCKATASHLLGLIYYEKNIFEESKALFREAALAGIEGLEVIEGSQEAQGYRQISFNIMRDALLAITKKNFKQNEDMIGTNKYRNEFLPLLKKGLNFTSLNEEERDDLTTAFNTFENYLSNIPSSRFHFWAPPILLQPGNENANSTNPSNYKSKNGI